MPKRAQIRVLWPGILTGALPNDLRGAELTKFLAMRPDVQSAARGSSYLREKLEKPLEVLMAVVLRMILGEVVLLVAIGIAIALPVAFACGKLISAMLFGVSATDPASVAFSAAILISVAATAGFLPARRASRVDPMVALRYE